MHCDIKSLIFLRSTQKQMQLNAANIRELISALQKAIFMFNKYSYSYDGDWMSERNVKANFSFHFLSAK